jgi:hypothetical protein
MLRVLLWDTLGASVGISTRTPYCSTVCLCLNNSLTLTLTHSRRGAHAERAPVGKTGRSVERLDAISARRRELCRMRVQSDVSFFILAEACGRGSLHQRAQERARSLPRGRV